MLKSLLTIRSTTRIAITLGCICASVIWCAFGLNIFPNAKSRVVKQRIELCESIAISIASLSNVQQTAEIEPFLESIATRNKQIVSVGVRNLNGELEIDLGDHVKKWQQQEHKKSSDDFMQLGLIANGEHDSNLEISFVSANQYSGMGKLFPATAVLFCAAASVCFFWFYLSRVLKHLNPSKVVPSRVKNALDSLAEGLILINEREEIVLANQAFSQLMGCSNHELMGINPATFAWQKDASEKFPWTMCLDKKTARSSDLLTLTGNDKTRKFIVNTTPVDNDSGKCSGVMVSFDDVTPFEEKQQELNKMLNLLRTSRDEVQRQNKELQVLASLDPLTGCLNRRAFFDRFKQLWSSPIGESLTVVMVDIDKFKSINDRFGHSTGDEVIKGIARILEKDVGENGLLCRFGGEEFCMLLVKHTIDQAYEMAEAVRIGIESEPIAEISLTCSIGVSARMFGAMDTQHLLDQADQCLYVAKRTGRNRVARWDECTAEQLAAVEQDEVSRFDQPIMHYSAVTAMLAALAIRDRATAEHSQRVSNLVVSVARTLLPASSIGDLEIAALLHDIGKIGLPDSVLLKTDPLSESDREQFKANEKMSIKIVESALANNRISDILKMRCVAYESMMDMVAENQTDRDSVLPAQILTVCDAFDSLTNEQPFRSAKSQVDAIDELMASASVEYDPTVVARLITVLHENPEIVDTPSLICNNPKTAYLISVKVDQLNQAIADRDFETVADIVDQIARHAIEDRVEPIVLAAQGLSATLQQNETEIDQIIEMTNEVMSLCRATRSTMITPTSISCELSDALEHIGS